MKKTFLAISIFSFLALASCADKMTDRHSELVGGNQGPPPPTSVTDAQHNGTPENSNGAGQLLASGTVNSKPDLCGIRIPRSKENPLNIGF